MKFSISNVRKIWSIASEMPTVPTVWEGMTEKNWVAFHQSVRAEQERDLSGLRSPLLERVARAGLAAETAGHGCPATILEFHRLLDRYDTN